MHRPRTPRPLRARRVKRTRSRPGMTIIEVLFAIVILSGVMLSLSRFGQTFTRATRGAANLGVASDLAAARVEAIRRHRDFATIVTNFDDDVETAATADAEPSMAGYGTYTRTTAITPDSSATQHVLRVTVTVTSPALTRPVEKTALIAAF